MTEWHLDRKVPMAIIAGLVVQGLMFAYSYGQVEARVDTLEVQEERLSSVPERLARIETLLEDIRDRLQNQGRRPNGRLKKLSTDPN